ncbi:MAG: hypothetical protein K2W96_17035 [Gemmataceae bacterium]|nr:hypothetical protein [Gemmataceae bacterium]
MSIQALEPTAAPAAPPAPREKAPVVPRLWLTAGILAGYYAARGPAIAAMQSALGGAFAPATVGLWLVAALLFGLAFVWKDVLATSKAYHAPLLITSVLIMADAGFSILENHPAPLLAWLTGGTVTSITPTFVAIATTILTELALGYFLLGRFPPLVSAYVSGISAGILVKTPYLWPFVLCGMLSITSKYVLRLGERHLWNPTNFGVTMLLFLAPQHVASLSVQAGNFIWAAAVIWVLGGMILWQLKLLHISATFVVCFVALSWPRAVVTGNSFDTEVAPALSPMFQLYIFFMITDPKTITRGWRRQVLVAALVAVAETYFRLAFRDVHSLYHALFTVGPAANLVESRGRRPLFVMAGLVAALGAASGLRLLDPHIISHALLGVAPAAWLVELCLPGPASKEGPARKE